MRCSKVYVTVFFWGLKYESCWNLYVPTRPVFSTAAVCICTVEVILTDWPLLLKLRTRKCLLCLFSQSTGMDMWNIPWDIRGSMLIRVLSSSLFMLFSGESWYCLGNHVGHAVSFWSRCESAGFKLEYWGLLGLLCLRWAARSWLRFWNSGSFRYC